MQAAVGAAQAANDSGGGACPWRRRFAACAAPTSARAGGHRRSRLNKKDVPQLVPEPSTPEQWPDDERFQGGYWMLIEIDLAKI